MYEREKVERGKNVGKEEIKIKTECRGVKMQQWKNVVYERKKGNSVNEIKGIERAKRRKGEVNKWRK